MTSTALPEATPMSDRGVVARSALHRMLRPRLLLSAAIVSVIVSVPPNSGASAFGLMGVHLGAGAGYPVLRPNPGYPLGGRARG